MYYFIVNPVAGGKRANKVFNKLKARLESEKIDYKYDYTETSGHATELAKKAALSGDLTVVCVGGDGTVAEVAEGLVGSDCAMGIIPSGTGNDFSRSLGISTEYNTALNQLLSAGEKSIDIGQMGEKYFLNSAGIGFDVDVVLHTPVGKMVKGLFAYFIGVLGALIKLKSRKLKITTDDRVIEKEVLLVVLSNGKHFGGGMKVCPDASLEDGKFDVVVIDKVKRLKVLRLLPKFISGKHVTLPIIEYFKSSEVEIEGESDYMQYDGRIIPYTSGKYKIRPKALKVLFPAG